MYLYVCEVGFPTAKLDKFFKTQYKEHRTSKVVFAYNTTIGSLILLYGVDNSDAIDLVVNIQFVTFNW